MSNLMIARDQFDPDAFHVYGEGPGGVVRYRATWPVELVEELFPDHDADALKACEPDEIPTAFDAFCNLALGPACERAAVANESLKETDHADY